MGKLTGSVAMDGSLCRVNRAIARSFSTKPAVGGRFRQALQVPEPKACRGRVKYYG